MTAERVELYRYDPLPGKQTPVGVQPFTVDNSNPEEEEIS